MIISLKCKCVCITACSAALVSPGLHHTLTQSQLPGLQSSPCQSCPYPLHLLCSPLPTPPSRLKRSFSKYPYSQKWLCTPGRDHILPDAHTPVKTWPEASPPSGFITSDANYPFGLTQVFSQPSCFLLCLSHPSQESLLLYYSIYYIILKMLFSGLCN